ncbi:MAG: metallophosphoesterase [Deltaproteobacteria bacterium]|nr:metallophosphoesterase [Deltaproteobacteria bacterium]
MFSPREILIVSDMHVGRSCKEITGFAQPRPDPEFDQAFIDLLDVYTANREPHWRLLLGGDFIDFMEVVVAPGAKGFLDLKLTFEVTDEEREFGLGSEAERVLIKLDRTFDYHRAYFRRLAEFVKAGGELVILRGNHDVEFHWRKVQRVFRKMLADLAFSGEQLEIDELLERRNAFQERIQFLPWIYFEPGRVYFEHGHQYDEYCSFDHWLHPVSPHHPRRIDTPISAFAMRYFVNLMSDFAPHNVEIWTWRDYVAWIRSKGLASALYTGRMFAGAMGRALVYAFQWTFGRVARYSKEHTKRLTEEAERFNVPLDKLSAIDNLHHTPVSRNLAELMRLLFLDRLLLGVGVLFLIMIFLLIAESAWVELAGIIMVAALAVRINRRLTPRRHLRPGPKQAAAAQRIAEILDVPLVAMGHSHVRRDIDLGHGRRYLNIGCWLPPPEASNHLDPSAPCTCKLSHLYVPREGAPELRVFCKASRTVRLSDIAEASAHTADILRDLRDPMEQPAP